MDMNDISQLEQAAGFGRSELFRLGTALLFIVGIMLFAGSFIQGVPGGVMLVAAWLITVPASAILALFYFTIRGMML
jgi:PiT family inorganic phosphate transporter